MKYITRHGAMRLLGQCHSESSHLRHGTRVILRTSRGQEVGTVLCEATPESVARIDSNHEEGKILREMTPDDHIEYRRLQSNEKEEYFRCLAIVQQSGLAMDLVRVEHIFGGERLLVYYVAEGRVDFRELVKVLAAEFQTRIEMRQIGVRDETKLLADFGDCGKEVCCNSYLVEMPPVSMKMAKLQKATLDPTKISGRCGRLKCCLRYEHDVYISLQNGLPPLGKHVETPQGTGKVLSHDILQQRVWVDLGELGRKPFPVADVKLV